MIVELIPKNDQNRNNHHILFFPRYQLPQTEDFWISFYFLPTHASVKLISRNSCEVRKKKYPLGQIIL